VVEIYVAEIYEMILREGEMRGPEMYAKLAG